MSTLVKQLYLLVGIIMTLPVYADAPVSADHAVISVPEPGAIVVMVLGLVGLLLARRKF